VIVIIIVDFAKKNLRNDFLELERTVANRRARTPPRSRRGYAPLQLFVRVRRGEPVTFRLHRIRGVTIETTPTPRT
jgi:hypothetical protein